MTVGGWGPSAESGKRAVSTRETRQQSVFVRRNSSQYSCDKTAVSIADSV
jgi:hypothetical protein